jgi:hypothetical protein
MSRNMNISSIPEIVSAIGHHRRDGNVNFLKSSLPYSLIMYLQYVVVGLLELF